MTEFHANSSCSGLIETKHSVQRCVRPACFWVRAHRDSEEGQHSCGRHLAQIARDVVNGVAGGCEPIIRVFGGAR